MSIALALIQSFLFHLTPVAVPEDDARPSHVDAAPTKAATQRQVQRCDVCW